MDLTYKVKRFLSDSGPGHSVEQVARHVGIKVIEAKRVLTSLCESKEAERYGLYYWRKKE